MKLDLSVIIICKNEVESIGHTLQSVITLSDDIVVLDTGSTDGTLDVLRRFPVQINCSNWEGFGRSRQKAVDLAKYNWVLIIDSDEQLSPELEQEIRGLQLDDKHVCYRVRLKNHLGQQYIRYGDWGNDYRIRLYNRNVMRWNESIVHEKLIVPEQVRQTKLKGTLFHQTARSVDELAIKMVHYGLLTAEQYFSRGKRSTWIKRHLGPAYTFVKNYIFLLGFLDGRNGYVIARVISFYTFLKYTRLHEMWMEQRRNNAPA
jgi:glycosyltransferase involved in cell wall biosynthesis